MRHLPNLLKQESSSAATLIHILTQMYFDPRPEHRKARPQISERLLPLGLGVIEDFNKLRQESQAKNILAWTPVVSEILDCFSRLDDKSVSTFTRCIARTSRLTPHSSRCTSPPSTRWPPICSTEIWRPRFVPASRHTTCVWASRRVS